MAAEARNYISTEWSLVAICLLFIINRLRVQIWIYQKNPLPEILPVLAWLLFLGSAVCESIGYTRHYYDVDITLYDGLPLEEKVKVLKADYAVGFFYKPSIYMCKFSLLLFYRELVTNTSLKKTTWSIYFTWFICISGCLTQIIFVFLKCRPISLNWVPDSQCTFLQTYYYANWAFHIFSDILVYVIPFVIMRHVTKLSFSKKMGALSMFFIGFLNIFMAGAALAIIVIDSTGVMFNAYLYLTVLQQGTAVFIVCMPQARFLYKKSIRSATREEIAPGYDSTRSRWDRMRRNKAKRNDIESILVPTCDDTMVSTTKGDQKDGGISVTTKSILQTSTTATDSTISYCKD